MSENLGKRPSKGILKTSSSFDRQDTPSTSKKSKGTQWDEMNIIATYHPADKDYGHMKIDEPKTPYNYSDGDSGHDQLDLGLLSEKLTAGATSLPRALQQDESDSEEETETPEQKEIRLKFENKRKEHYNEFHAIKMARKLLEEEEEDDDEVVENVTPSHSPVDMEVEDISPPKNRIEKEGSPMQ